ncbi:MAG: hypothetical protein ABL877_03255 [Thiobacillus sp.]
MPALTYAPARLWSAAALLACLAGNALAHTDSWFDTHATPNGGQVRMAGPYHLELMPPGNEVVVYVTDHGDTKIPTAGWNAHIITLTKGKKTRILLKPAGDNKLVGKARLQAGAQAVLNVSPKAGEEYSARFKPESTQTQPHAAHAH